MTGIKKPMVAAASTAAVCGVLYLGACAWQLHEFDELLGEGYSNQAGLFVFNGESKEGGLFHRSILVQIGLLDEPLIHMNGRFTPGLFPSLEFDSIDSGNSGAGVFLKSDPKALLKFNPMLEPISGELSWNEAEVGVDKLGAGRITADFEIDRKSKSFKMISVDADFAPSSSSWGESISGLEGVYSSGSVKIGEKNVKYKFTESPRKFSLSYSSGPDSIVDEHLPMMTMGPYGSDLSIKQIEKDGKKLNAASFSFNLGEFAVKGDYLPPIDISSKGALLTPENVWIPCIASRLMLGASHLVLLPGVCPEDPEYDVFEKLAEGSLDFILDELKLEWKGASVLVSGKFNPVESASFNVKVAFDGMDASSKIHSARTFTMQVKNYMEDLRRQGVVSLSSDGVYEMKIDMSTDEDGRGRILGNGVDLTKVDARLDLIDPSMDSRVVRIVVKRARPELQDEMMSSVAAPLEDLASKSKGTANWISTQEEDGRYILDVVAEDYEALSELVDAFDAELKRIKEEMPEGIEAEMLSAASNSVGTFDD